jgi:hypothetical protein
VNAEPAHGEEASKASRRRGIQRPFGRIESSAKYIVLWTVITAMSKPKTLPEQTQPPKAIPMMVGWRYSSAGDWAGKY